MKCTFCGHKIPDATGKIVVEKTGKLLYFCSSKCEKNTLKLKRKPLNVRWTARARDSRAQAKAPAKKKR